MKGTFKAFASAMFAIALLLLITFVLSIGQVGQAFDVELAWGPSTSPGVSYYSIHYGMQSGIYVEPINVGLNFSGWITNLINGEMYYFTVSCTDIEGLRSGFCNEVFTDGVTVIPDGNPPFPPDSGCFFKSINP